MRKYCCSSLEAKVIIVWPFRHRPFMFFVELQQKDNDKMSPCLFSYLSATNCLSCLLIQDIINWKKETWESSHSDILFSTLSIIEWKPGQPEKTLEIKMWNEIMRKFLTHFPWKCSACCNRTHRWCVTFGVTHKNWEQKVSHIWHVLVSNILSRVVGVSCLTDLPNKVRKQIWWREMAIKERHVSHRWGESCLLSWRPCLLLSLPFGYERES